MSGPGRIRQMTFNQTFQSSLVERNQDKFMLEKSLARGIKQNDISKIIDKGEERELADEKQLYDEYGETQAVLVDARKHYDQVKTHTLKLQKQIQKLKAKRQTLKTDEDKLKFSHESRRKQMQEVQRHLQEISQTMNYTLYRKQIYQNIKQTTKADILLLKKRYFDKDVRLMRENTKLKSLRTQAATKTQLSKRCKQVLQSMQKTVVEKVNERTSKINSVYQVLNKKQHNQIRKEQRDKEIEEAMISAMTDKLPQQKQWNKILQANLFLKGMLRQRMQNLMIKHSKEEIAFHKMKQQTNLRDANQLVERYLHKEQYYGQLLESISQKQQRLQNLKEQKQQIDKEYQNMLYQNEEINEERMKVKGVTEHEFQVLQSLNSQLLRIERQKQLVYLWATRFLSVYKGQKTRTKMMEKWKKSQTKSILLQVLSTMKQFLNQLQKQQNSQQKVQAAILSTNPKQTLNEDNAEKNTRIKTLSSYDEMYNNDFEDKDMIYDDLSEMDYLQYNRRAIKKNDLQNRKFRIKTKPY